MRVLGVITARGGSKGIPGKNLVPLLGKPLLAYTVEAASDAKELDRVILSTEDEEIAGFGRSLGVDVPFRRPAELATDQARHTEVLQHAVRSLDQEGDRYDAVLTLQPTSPLRTAADIDGAIALMRERAADAVISLVEACGVHPHKMKTLSSKGHVVDPPFASGKSHVPRQELPPFYVPDGSIYLTRVQLLMGENAILGGITLPWFVPVERWANIDHPRDLLIAEAMLNALQRK
jgi:CMP-N,N'-diacetyllegionaminic acid synthase